VPPMGKNSSSYPYLSGRVPDEYRVPVPELPSLQACIETTGLGLNMFGQVVFGLLCIVLSMGSALFDSVLGHHLEMTVLEQREPTEDLASAFIPAATSALVARPAHLQRGDRGGGHDEDKGQQVAG
jgi:hypothetical protein